MISETLYHGSFTIISSPDLSKCMPGKDFGKGFYVTATREQADRFVKNSVGKAMKNGIIQENQGYGYVSVFQYEPIQNLRIHEFSDADGLWLQCIAGNRKHGLFANKGTMWGEYDIIAGKIANDNTNKIITNYINGDYGTPDLESAIRDAIRYLEPDNLADQECFLTVRALKCLKFMESYEVKI